MDAVVQHLTTINLGDNDAEKRDILQDIMQIPVGYNHQIIDTIREDEIEEFNNIFINYRA